MRILNVLAFALLNLSTFFVVGQIQTRELPPSYLNGSEKNGSINYLVQLDDPNVASKIAEDAITDEHKDIAWRFGALVPVNYNLSNSGEWSYDDDNGISTWKLKISFQQAKSINLNFNNLHLSANANLFVYNEDYTDILGAITAKNNKTDRLFSIRPIKGSAITLELIVPQNEQELNIISCNEVIYGYRSIHDKVQKVFQGSENCNINVNCGEGKNWQDVKRSVAMVTAVNNTRFCTATLINNVRQDTTPYILGAAHCVLRNNSIFIFGYESALCSPNTDGVLSNSISGSARKAIAVNFGSDFELRELSSRPPASYNVYYAGWNNQNIASTKSVGIHHPTGDVKKISIDNDVLISSGYYSSGVTHWQVSGWEKGTTESGSSGSAIFDVNQRIIGQLHGGDASCKNKLQDYYGKFSYSWNTSTDTLRQLKQWLDPDNTGALVVDGLDPNPSSFNVDLDLLDIDGVPEFECTQNVQAILRVKNIGNNAVDSFYVDYKLNGNAVQSILYATSTTRQEIVTFNTPSLSPISGINVLVITIRTAGVLDQNLTNNSDSIVFNINTSTSGYLYLSFKSDDYGSETSWQLEDFNTNSILYTSPYYPDADGGMLYTDSLCAYIGCFRFSIFDAIGDGFNDPTNTFGNGYLLITNRQSDTLFYENNFTTSLSTDTFCLRNVTSLSERIAKDQTIDIFPNPIMPGEVLRLNSTVNFSLNLRNVQGQLVTQVSRNQFTVPENLTSGIYFLEIRALNNSSILDIKKVLIQ